MAVFFLGNGSIQEQPQNAIKSVQFAADEGTPPPPVYKKRQPGAYLPVFFLCVEKKLQIDV